MLLSVWFKVTGDLPNKNITAKLNGCKTKTFNQKTVQKGVAFGRI